MANPVWISSDGDWSNTASWDTGSVPASGDTTIFDGISSVVSVTSGLNQSAIDLAEIAIYGEYTGDFGTSGGNLLIDAEQITHYGSGTLYLTGGGGKITDLVVNGHGTVIMTGAIGEVYCIAGTVNLLGGAAGVLRVFTFGPTANITIATGAETTIQSLYIAGGNCTCSREITTEAFVTSEGVLTIDNLYPSGRLTVALGGRIIMKPTTTAQTLTALHVLDGGIVEFARGMKDLTIADAVYAPAATIIGPPSARITITTLQDLREDYP